MAELFIMCSVFCGILMILATCDIIIELVRKIGGNRE